jgi:hypothetical protein
MFAVGMMAKFNNNVVGYSQRDAERAMGMALVSLPELIFVFLVGSFWWAIPILIREVLRQQ